MYNCRYYTLFSHVAYFYALVTANCYTNCYRLISIAFQATTFSAPSFQANFPPTQQAAAAPAAAPFQANFGQPATATTQASFQANFGQAPPTSAQPAFQANFPPTQPAAQVKICAGFK